jgi:serine/threonine-protein kinase RsbW
MLADLTQPCRQEAVQVSPRSHAWRRRTLHRPDEIHAAIDRVLDAALAAGFSAREGFGVRMALEEALVNAIKHGHHGDPTKRVRLRYCLKGDWLLVEIEDEGSGFDPHQVADPSAPENWERPSGRGLLLIRHYMTWVRYNDAGNCVTLCKRHETP